jgi:Toprim domain
MSDIKLASSVQPLVTRSCAPTWKRVRDFGLPTSAANGVMSRPPKRRDSPTEMTGLDFSIVDRVTGGRLGTHDVPCPLCRPFKSLHGQRRKVMRIWRVEPNFASYHCARCGEKGYAREYGCSAPLDPMKLAKARAAAVERERQITKQRLDLARWLWRRRLPIIGSIGEKYFVRRGYRGPLPPTLAFLPPWRDYPPAVMAAYGIATEPDSYQQRWRWLRLNRTAAEPVPGIEIADDAVLGVHLIKLKPDGSDRLRDHDLGDDEEAKITIGRDFVAPIVLAPPNDLLALTIAEGIEDALNDHQATGRGAWAAGSASRMPALAAIVPGYIENVTVLVDGNKAGRDGSTGLAAGLYARGIEALLTPVGKAAIP